MGDMEKAQSGQVMRGWTNNDIVKLLLELARRLQELDDSLEKYEKDYVEKAELYNQAHTKAFLRARSTKTEDGKNNPQYVCEAIADDETGELKLAMDLAQVMVRAQKRKIEILRTRIDVGRTAASSLRAELELERTHR